MTHTPFRLPRQVFHAIAFVTLAATLSGCATSPPPIYPTTIELSSAQRAAFSDYENQPLQKAFAGAPGLYSGSASLASTGQQAARSALANCQKEALQPCRVFNVSGVPYQQAYTKFSEDSGRALAAMNVPREVAYHLEAMDWGVKSTDVREGKILYHAPTPMTFQEFKSISTAQLAQRMKGATITLIDARGFTDIDLPTIPNAYSIDWAGTLDGDDREPVLQRNFAKIMQLIVPDHATPIAVFCWSAQCWVSVHAAQRLHALGYTDVFWYRGGIEAWKAAKLPTVTAVPHATVWSE